MNVLMFGDTETSTDLFAAIPATIGDPFLYVETGERRIAMVSTLDRGTVEGADPGIEVVDPLDHGFKDLLRSGMTRKATELEVARRALADLGVREAIVPWHFPVGLADVLRADGVALTVDGDVFDDRRRIKTEVQLAGIRRAQAAADAAMGVARDLIHACAEGLTAEAVRKAMQETAAEHGCLLGDDVVVGPNEQGAAGHDPGSGPIVAGDGVIVDIWPRDTSSRCWADMTRTFVAGGGANASSELQEYWELSREALARVTEAVRPGINGSALNDIASEVFEAAGKPTARKADGALADGFFHGLGHGVGLDVHELPGMGISGNDLMPGDVIAVEPGCYRHDYGGVRLEDLLLVTSAGCEVLTNFPYDL